ncbi:hypothetical protein M124_2206 [Bacteroides fragilis str. 3988T(B)14]|uniref:Uncharacterized protein n=1 Tax=Bacteroides fragilis str. 3988T(B)14 TaxID=1339315 RepID=A0A015TTN8_BACFG|nr:hypothetical protein M124_2206 [Bacteroides fragilis str. 3988T(B)14]EXY79975.1 hypothetical protein M084_2308 [Bacteroides fragilis str. 3988 T1]
MQYIIHYFDSSYQQYIINTPYNINHAKSKQYRHTEQYY